MQTTEWNRRFWNERYDWSDGGDVWSGAWGSPEKQWYGAILPRIAEFLPTGACLEIAPGFGRWTQFLLQVCQHVTAVDLSSRCIDACRQRFAGCKQLTLHVNDGKSLDMIPDGSIDFVFSFDSLVHAEWDALDAYLKQLKKKLKPHGVGFMHHSNIGNYSGRFLYRRIPIVKSVVKRLFPAENTITHGRAFSLTAQRFQEMAKQAGLSCWRQELINWGSHHLIDCLSVFGAQNKSSCTVTRNPQFMDETRHLRDQAKVDDLKKAAERLLQRRAA